MDQFYYKEQMSVMFVTKQTAQFRINIVEKKLLKQQTHFHFILIIHLNHYFTSFSFQDKLFLLTSHNTAQSNHSYSFTFLEETGKIQTSQRIYLGIIQRFRYLLVFRYFLIAFLVLCVQLVFLMFLLKVQVCSVIVITDDKLFVLQLCFPCRRTQAPLLITNICICVQAS